MRTFSSITGELLARLRDAVGAAYVHSDAENRERYGHDETEHLSYPPDVVVRPETTEQVAQVLCLAWEADVPVTPRGGGTGLSGGALAVFGGVGLSLDRMDRILEIDVPNRVCVVQPGLVTQTLQEAVAERGLYYPPDPASLGSCAIGGNIAENAGGPHCVKYGVTRDYVLALEAVTPDGRVFRTGGKLLKDVAGYDLTHLLVGSEGTLAVVTEATLRLLPLPSERRVLLAPFEDLQAAAHAVVAIHEAHVIPAALEIIDHESLRVAQRHLGRSIPYADAQAQLLVELDGMEAEAVERDLGRVGEVLLEAGAVDVLVPQGAARIADLWAVRRCLGEAVKSHPRHRECDVAVPLARVPDLIRAAQEEARRHGVRQVSFGHAGDGNIHVNLFTERQRGVEALVAAAEAVFEAAVAMGGTITGEHGVGCVKSRYLPLCRDEVALDLMRRVKTAFDPKGLLNPGKIFEEQVPRPL